MIVFLPTDGVMLLLLALLLLTVRFVLTRPNLRARWRAVFADAGAASAAVVLAFFLTIATLDSMHYRPELPPSPNGARAYSPATVSVFDTLVFDVLDAAHPERSYSAPFAMREFDKTTVVTDLGPVRDFQPLKVAPRAENASFLLRGLAGGAAGLLAALCATGLLVAVKRGEKRAFLRRFTSPSGERFAPWLTFTALLTLTGVVLAIWPVCHPFGTDAVGNDVLYEALKSLRTAIVIGSLATLATLPFAVTLGMAAGYFKGRVDDAIQYLYTTLSSIPSVLLIAASVLLVTVFMDRHPEWWPTGLERADVRLFLLAIIIGMTGWSTLARLLRAETMKITALDYVTAARAFGVPHARILRRHVLPNVLHIVLIVTVLDFSGIVLYEAVLSYVGVGVDPSMSSFGTMINAARSEMSRSPMVWWNLAASFLFMLSLVLSANLFAAAVRDAFDPRAALTRKGGAE